MPVIGVLPAWLGGGGMASGVCDQLSWHLGHWGLAAGLHFVQGQVLLPLCSYKVDETFLVQMKCGLFPDWALLCVYEHKGVCSCICMHVCVYMHVVKHVSVYKYTGVCVHVYINTFIDC